jgi:hypothetical protein
MYRETIRAYRVLECGTDHYTQQKSSAPGKTEEKKIRFFIFFIFYILATLNYTKSLRNGTK